MNICIITSDYLPNVGGISAHVDGVSRGFLALGESPIVFHTDSCRNPLRVRVNAQDSNGLQVISLRSWYSGILGRNQGWARRTAGKIRQATRNSQWDVVNWHTPINEPLIKDFLKRRLSVFTNHTSQFLEWVRDSSSHPLARGAVNNADLVLCPSTELAEATAKIGVGAERIRFVPNGVDTSRFNPDVDGTRIRNKFGIPTNAVLVLCPRRLEKKNGVSIWLRSLLPTLEKLPKSLDVHFMLVGDYQIDDQYSDRRNVSELIQRMNLRDRFTWVGSVPPDEMPEYMSASDIVVLPSLMEATSIAGLEAMASGKPLIGTNVGGIPQIIENGRTGVLVPPSDVDALAEATIALVIDRDHRMELSRNSRRTALEKFSWNGVAKKTISIFEEFLS